MAVELIYTSAIKGVKPGSHGFCTVAVTEGMPSNLVERLEGLSAYREHYRANGPQANDNPINYQYSSFRIGGRVYPILSRVSFAGFEHTGRTNLLAHHIALTNASEQAEVGPAAVASVRGAFVETWSSPPKTMPPRTLGFPVRPSLACPTWLELVGDAGWAGAIAQHTIAHPESLVAIIFNPQTARGNKILSLFNEALAFVPPELRWDVTFSSYLTDLPLETTCRWRAIVPGSPELEKLRRLPNLLKLDLTGDDKLQTPEGELTEAAREGRSPYRGRRSQKPETTDHTASGRLGRISIYHLKESVPQNPQRHMPIKAPQVEEQAGRFITFAWIGIGVLVAIVFTVAWVLFHGPGTRTPVVQDSSPLQAPLPSRIERLQPLPAPQPNNTYIPRQNSLPSSVPAEELTEAGNHPSTAPANLHGPIEESPPPASRPSVTTANADTRPFLKDIPDFPTTEAHPIAPHVNQMGRAEALMPFTCTTDAPGFESVVKAWNAFQAAGYFKRPAPWSPGLNQSLSVSIRVHGKPDTNGWMIGWSGDQLLIMGRINESDVSLMKLTLDEQKNLVSVALLKQALKNAECRRIIFDGTFRIQSAEETLLEFHFLNQANLQEKLKTEKAAFTEALKKLNLSSAADLLKEFPAKQDELRKSRENGASKAATAPTSNPAADNLQARVDALAKAVEQSRRLDLLEQAIEAMKRSVSN